MKIYNLISQGVLVYSTCDEKEAVEKMERSNREWRKYCQECIESGERPADNEVFMDIVEVTDELISLMQREERKEVLTEVQSKLALGLVPVYIVMASIEEDYKNGEFGESTYRKLMAHWKGRAEVYKFFSEELALLDNANTIHSLV